jgi:hypothetical protein
MKIKPKTWYEMLNLTFIFFYRGEYRNGTLEGKARIYFQVSDYLEKKRIFRNSLSKLSIVQDRSWLEGYFKQGILHGFTRIFDKKVYIKKTIFNLQTKSVQFTLLAGSIEVCQQLQGRVVLLLNSEIANRALLC